MMTSAPGVMWFTIKEEDWQIVTGNINTNSIINTEVANKPQVKTCELTGIWKTCNRCSFANVCHFIRYLTLPGFHCPKRTSLKQDFRSSCRVQLMETFLLLMKRFHLLVFVGTGTMAVNCFDTLISLHAWSHSGDDLTWKLRKWFHVRNSRCFVTTNVSGIICRAYVTALGVINCITIQN